jgi:hypothetical protein
VSGNGVGRPEPVRQVLHRLQFAFTPPEQVSPRSALCQGRFQAAQPHAWLGSTGPIVNTSVSVQRRWANPPGTTDSPAHTRNNASSASPKVLSWSAEVRSHRRSRPIDVCRYVSRGAECPRTPSSVRLTSHRLNGQNHPETGRHVPHTCSVSKFSGNFHCIGGLNGSHTQEKSLA